MLLNIEALTASLGQLLGGDTSAGPTGGEQLVVSFADLLGAQVLVAGEIPDAATADGMVGLALRAGSPEARVLPFDQLAEPLSDGPPAAATELTLDLPQEASSEAGPTALITLTQMMSLLHIPTQLSAAAPVEDQLQAPDSDAGSGSDPLENGQSLLAVTSADALPLAGDQISLTGLVALTGSQPQVPAPQLAAPSPPLESNETPVKAVVDGPVLARANLGAEIAKPGPVTPAAGDVEPQFAAGQLAQFATDGETEPQLAAVHAGKESSTAPAGARPKVEQQQEASLPNLRPTPNLAPSNPVPTFVPIEAPADLPDIPALKQVIDTVEFLTQKGQTEVRLHLHPKELGQLHVQLHMIEGQVVVRMVAESSQAQTLIQDHLVQLKAAFAAQGLQVDQLTVNVGGGGADANPFGQPDHGRFNQPSFDSYSGLPGEAPEQTSPESKKIRSWGLAQSVDYKI